MQLLAPNAYQTFQTRTGVNYTSDKNQLISATGADVVDLIGDGCIPLVNSPSAQFRNLLDGGDFSVNPFQRNIAAYATSNALTTPITNTPGYFADRFFGVSGSASGSCNFTKVANTSVPGFNYALQFGRTAANTNTATLYMGQVIETLDSIRAQGQTVTFSFWAAAGANFSAANNTITAQIISGTGSNQSAANMVAGSWTGQSNIVSATQVISGSMTRYSFTGVVPAGCTQLGVLVSYVPVGTAGAADNIQFMGMQLEIGASASVFEHRDAQVELEICQRYAWVTAEPASGVIVGTGGATQAANAQVFYMAAPVQFYTAPTVSVVAGSFKVCAGAAAAAATSFAAGTTHTVNAISTTTALTQTAGGSATLQGGGGSGAILASCDF